MPNEGGFDFLSDISGTKIAFVRSANSRSAIYVFDTAVGGNAVEVAPEAGSFRRKATIGGDTVAWQDWGLTASTVTPEIVAHDLTTGVSTRLSDDAQLDTALAVSPDGDVIVWTKCLPNGTGCDIWKATKGPLGWSPAMALTGPEGEEGRPDTNGEIVVYSSERSMASSRLGAWAR